MVGNKQKARLIILATFALGMLTGVLGTTLFMPRPASPAGPQGMVDELAAAVRLDTAQRTQVQQILAETRQQYQEIQKQVRPQFNDIRSASRTRIRALLTPDQQLLYDEWLRQRDAKREQRLKDASHDDKGYR
jgi:uncharacterized membrane protein